MRFRFIRSISDYFIGDGNSLSKEECSLREFSPDKDINKNLRSYYLFRDFKNGIKQVINLAEIYLVYRGFVSEDFAWNMITSLEFARFMSHSILNAHIQDFAYNVRNKHYRCRFDSRYERKMSDFEFED